MAPTRFAPRKCTVFAVMTSLATLMAPALAYADAASDIRSDSSLRLWLDGFDTNAANSNGYGTVSNPVSGQPVRTWRDKSSHGHHAVDTTPPLYGNAATWSNQGVFFNYNSLARFELPISVYGNSPSNAMEVIAFARAGDSGTIGGNQPLLEMRNDGLGVVSIYVASAGVQQSVNGIVHQSDYRQQQFGTGYLIAGYSTSAGGSGSGGQPIYGTIVNIRANGAASSMILRQEGTLVHSLSGTVPQYANSPSGKFVMGGAVSTFGYGGYYGYAGTVMIFDRILKTAERNILLEYASLWNRTDDSYYSVTGLFNRSYYWASYNGYPYMFFRQYLGGIGMEADGSVTTGTSAGLTVTNVSFLTNGAYLLAATETPSSVTKVPNTGTVLAADAALYIRGELPAGYTAASQRRWLIDRTGGSTGSVKMRFDLKNMGVSPKLGQTLGLLSSTLGGNPYTARATAVYDGSGAIEFTVANPPDGIYTVGIGPDVPPPPSIVRTLTSVSQSDGFSSSNFFNLPGSILRQTATFSNRGGSSPTANSVKVDVPIKPSTKLRLADLGAVGSGPVLFSGSTTPPVGLSYTYSGLASTTDGLSFSNDNGTTYDYTPVPDADLADANVTHFRVTLPGTFAFSATTPYPTFTLTYDVKIK